MKKTMIAVALAVALAPAAALAHKDKGANGQVDFSGAGATPTEKAHATVSGTKAPSNAHQGTGFDTDRLPENFGPQN